MKIISINRFLIAAFTFITAAFLYSCQKDANSKTTTTSVSQTDAANYSDESAQADGSFDDVDDITINAADADNTALDARTDHSYHPDFSELREAIGLCATITVSPNDSTFPKTITIDFGDSCVGLDGKLRSGKIIITLTGRLRKAGSVVTTTLENFYVNHIHVEGTKTITNLSENGTIKFSVSITNGRVTFPSGRGYTYESTKLRVQTAGMDTPTCLDNVFQITGTAKIVFNNGKTITFEVVDPLIKKVLCPWRSDGTLKISINDFVLNLDYGFPHNGDCDNKALLTWNNGNSQRVILLP